MAGKDYDSRVKALYRKAVIGIHGVFEEYGIEGVSTTAGAAAM